MRNKLLAFLREHNMVQPGDTVICAVSGGADSMALLWAMYLLKEKLGIRLEAAHFNHNLRGEESRSDAVFVKDFCHTHQIILHMGEGKVQAGGKGLEAAAREARYAFLQSLPGKIATAHTADDNAETLLMHLVRGTGLKGLGGICPVRGNLIRPMLTVTRQEVLQFLEQQSISYVNDSSNETDDFLRNRIRHHVMPLLQGENPSIGANLSATALRLRQDEEALDALSPLTTDVAALRKLPAAIQTRVLAKLLVDFGVKEPEGEHIDLLRRVVYSENPSAYGEFPGRVTVGRQYGNLVKLEDRPALKIHGLQCPGQTEIPELDMIVLCRKPAENPEGLLVSLGDNPVLRGRREGDSMVLSGGTKTLKKLFIDKKIPAADRNRIPVIADDGGVAAVVGIGPNQSRKDPPNWELLFERVSNQQSAEQR